MKRFTIDMAEAFGLDRRIEAYSGKRPIGFYRWDLDCLLAVMDLALKDQRAYPDKTSSAYAALKRLRDRLQEEYRRTLGMKGTAARRSCSRDHDAFNAHENEISGRQNHVTAMPRYALSFASTELDAKPV